MKHCVLGLGICHLQNLFPAGSDTVRVSYDRACFLPTLTFETVSAMYSFFLALVLFPQVQRRGQAEIDAVIGRDRLPSFDDRLHLPYIDAVCKELMRWRMVTPMGTFQFLDYFREPE